MDSPTPHFTKMLGNLKHARKIVYRVDPAGCKNDLQHLKLRSYVMLCHSVVEEYIEDLGLDVALKARRILIEEGQITKALVALVTAGVLDEARQERALRKISSDLVRNLETFSEQAFNLYRGAVASNNGIKPDNLNRIFLPIGFDPSYVDFSLCNILDNLGTRRGGMAHKFVIQQEMTLSSFETDISIIERDLTIFDQEACSCLLARMAV